MYQIKKLVNAPARFSPALIPNVVNHKFYARLKDGSEVECETYQQDFGVRMGIRSTCSKSPISYDQVMDWTEQ